VNDPAGRDRDCESAEPRRELTPYAPPEGDAPLDRVEQALVDMWVDIIVQEILDEEAASKATP